MPDAPLTRADLVERIARGIDPDAFDGDVRNEVRREHARMRGRSSLAAIHDAGCAVSPREIDDALADTGLAATASWLDIKGSALTVNREKMKRRYQRIVVAADLAKEDG